MHVSSKEGGSRCGVAQYSLSMDGHFSSAERVSVRVVSAAAELSRTG